MSEAGDAWDVPAIERTLQQLLAHPEAAARITEGEPALESVRRQVLWEWQRRLIVERNANSEAAETPSEEPFGRPEQRFAREASIFELPRWPMYCRSARCSTRLKRGLGERYRRRRSYRKTRSKRDCRRWPRQIWKAPCMCGAAVVMLLLSRPRFDRAASRSPNDCCSKRRPTSRKQQRLPATPSGLSCVRCCGPIISIRRGVSAPNCSAIGPANLSTALDLLLAPGAAAPATQPRRAPATPAAPTRTPPQTTPLSRSPRRVPLIIALAALGVVLLALIIWTLPGAMRRTGGVASPSTLRGVDTSDPRRGWGDRRSGRRHRLPNPRSFQPRPRARRRPRGRRRRRRARRRRASKRSSRPSCLSARCRLSYGSAEQTWNASQPRSCWRRTNNRFRSCLSRVGRASCCSVLTHCPSRSWARSR